jgi:hypothetical protein
MLLRVLVQGVTARVAKKDSGTMLFAGWLRISRDILDRLRLCPV